MAVRPRIRFEIFKRDSFTCRYCGRKSPEVVLELEHVTALANGGTDDEMNLVTSCWECNRGKSDIPLNEVITGEDPTERAILILEKRRQLDEYNAVLAAEYARRTSDLQSLTDYWYDNHYRKILNGADQTWIFNTLESVPVEVIRNAMAIAIRSRKTAGLAYVNAIVQRWREEHLSDD